MANVTQVYPNKYVKPQDLIKPVLVTITGAAVEQLRNPRTNGRETKIVLYFHETEKALPLNRTQANALAELLNDPESDHWTGARIKLARAIAPNGAETIAISAAPAPTGRQPQPDSQAPEPAAAADQPAAGSQAAADPNICPIHNLPFLPITTRRGDTLQLHKMQDGSGYCDGHEVRPIKHAAVNGS